LQDVFNLLPNLNVNELIKAFAGNHAFTITDLIFPFSDISYNSSLNFHFFGAVKTNDMMLVIYLSSLIRSVIALHNLINNKVSCFHPPPLLLAAQSLYAFVGSLTLPFRLISSLILITGYGIILFYFQMLNKEHEKAEDSKPTAIPTAAGS
jgi:26S proteasome regulatory subunit N8